MRTVFYVEPKRSWLDRRVFRRMESGHLEWTHMRDWLEDFERARFYGFCSTILPDNCDRIEL